MPRVALVLLACATAVAAAWAQTPPRPTLTSTELARALKEKGSVLVPALTFPTGKATIATDSTATLAAIGELLKTDSSLRLDIQAHSSEAGQTDANLALSQARAAAVRDYLMATFDIDGGRLTATGFGDTDPIADTRTPQGRAENERVELVRTVTKGAATAPADGPGEWTGRIVAGLMAVGGETTGIVLQVDQDRFELQPADQAMRRRLRELDGKTVIVRGTLESRPGVEVRTRRVITVAEVEEK